ELATLWNSVLNISRFGAMRLGQSALEATLVGHYLHPSAGKVSWKNLVEQAVSAKISISPDAALPSVIRNTPNTTLVQVRNETTLVAGKRLHDQGVRPLALNLANGIHPGGGFLSGARAQEEVLCRSSALYATLVGDPMYAFHLARPLPDSSEWTILSPDVPVFRNDQGEALPQPWPCSFITCAAPYAHSLDSSLSRNLLNKRIHRVLGIAEAFGFKDLVLGAWGCGAFGNDPSATAADFKEALAGDFAGVFRQVVFAITDWSPNRKFLGPFRDTF
ncbi:MAG: TIGR02452 family protein, partial [Planctomycetota bacterium]